MYCDRCHLLIGVQKRIDHKKPGTSGDHPDDFYHFHNRERGDCYYLFLRDQIITNTVLQLAQSRSAIQ